MLGPIGAGRWHLVGDGVILHSCDLQFDVLWNSQTVVSFSHHFDANGFDAVAFDGDADGAQVAASRGDPLTLRFTVVNADASGPAFIPNADGTHAHGRIPSLTLP